MVEFIRDVIIVLAILVTLIALAFHPASEPETNRSHGTLTNRISASGTIKPAHEVVLTKAATPASLTK